MLNKVIYKLKNINLIILLKKFIKTLLLNGTKMAIAYQITIFLLGYSVFTPLLVRIFNITQKSNVVDCAGMNWGFNMGTKAPEIQQSLSGLTWPELIIGAVVMGSVYFTLNQGLNYFSESIYPPFMRSMGYDYYTLKEKNSLLLDKANMVLEQNRMAAMVIDQLGNDILTIDKHIRKLHGYLTKTDAGSLLHKFRFEFNVVNTSVIGVQNTILDMQRGQLRLIQEKLMILERSLGNVSTMTADLASRPIPNLREDLAEINLLFRDFQNNVLGTISEPITMLRAQVHALETFEPNELHTVTDRLRQTLGAFEHLAGQVHTAGANIEAVMQNSAQRIEEYETQVVEQGPTTTLSRVNGNSDVPNNVPTEAYVAGLENARQNMDNGNNEYDLSSQQASTSGTTMGSRVSNSQEVVQYFNRPMSGSYRFEQNGDELLIRLSLRGVNVPLTEMSTNGSLAPVRGAFHNVLSSDLVMSGAVSVLGTYGPRIAISATQAFATMLGYGSIYRSLSNAPRVAAAEGKIEAAIEGVKTGAVALFNVMTK